MQTIIAFIVKTKRDKFIAIVGRLIESEGDNDSFINVVGMNGNYESESEAVDFIKTNSKNILEFYPKSIKGSSDRVTWLSQLKNANPDGPITLQGTV